MVGAGAGGTLVATHLVTALSSGFRVDLVDPAPTTESARHEDRVFRDVVAPLCTGLVSVVEERWNAASSTLTTVVATMAPLGGSKAQREVVEDTLVHALAMAGRTTEAAAVLDERLSRRSSALDARRRAAVGAPAHADSTGW